jgi:hypothetical protein
MVEKKFNRNGEDAAQCVKFQYKNCRDKQINIGNKTVFIVDQETRGKKENNFKLFISKDNPQGAKLNEDWGSKTLARNFHTQGKRLNTWLTDTGNSKYSSSSFFPFYSYPSHLIVASFLWSGDFSPEFIVQADLPIPNRNANRTGGAGINPGSDNEDLEEEEEDDDDPFVQQQQQQQQRDPPTPTAAAVPPASPNILDEINKAVEGLEKLAIDKEGMRVIPLLLKNIPVRGDRHLTKDLNVVIAVCPGGIDINSIQLKLSEDGKTVDVSYKLGASLCTADVYIPGEVEQNEFFLTSLFGALTDYLNKEVNDVNNPLIYDSTMVTLVTKAVSNDYNGLVDPHELLLKPGKCMSVHQRILVHNTEHSSEGEQQVVGAAFVTGFFWAEGDTKSTPHIDRTKAHRLFSAEKQKQAASPAAPPPSPKKRKSSFLSSIGLSF